MAKITPCLIVLFAIRIKAIVTTLVAAMSTAPIAIFSINHHAYNYS